MAFTSTPATTVVKVFDMATFGEGTGLIWLDDVFCSGLENQLLDCGSSGLGVNDCSHGEDAGVRCGGSFIAICHEYIH